MSNNDTPIIAPKHNPESEQKRYGWSKDTAVFAGYSLQDHRLYSDPLAPLSIEQRAWLLNQDPRQFTDAFSRVYFAAAAAGDKDLIPENYWLEIVG